ncbi:MAG: hypothetical protein Q8M17_12320 [Actinomycetota bacterium]|nr:hypothetical protein [Actinomycetota bacterium]
MPDALAVPNTAPGSPHPHRMMFVVAESLIAVGGVAGAVQLITDTATPPVSDIEPLGLTSWVVPGVWLFASVGVPAGTAAWLAWRRSPNAPVAVLVASGLLGVELAVQIPFIGPSVLQAVFGTAAIGMAGLAIHARHRGWRRA